MKDKVGWLNENKLLEQLERDNIELIKLKIKLEKIKQILKEE